MRPLFFTVITISQFFGALLAFAYVDVLVKQRPLTTDQQLALAVLVLVFLPGLLGSILIWVRRRTGIWLSLIHQILLIPLFIIPNVYFYVLSDAVGFALGVLLWGGNFNVNFAFNIGSNTLLNVIKPPAGAAYYGVNVFALLCALYLNKLRRSEELARAMTDSAVRAIDLPALFARIRERGRSDVLRRPFLILITISQFLGVLLTVGVGSVQLLRAPAVGADQIIDFAFLAVIYVFALAGSILIWARRRAGIWLSLAHQIFVIPVLVIPNGFTYAMGDAVNVAFAVGTGAKLDYRLALNVGGNMSPQLQPAPGELIYYGVNLTALLCAVYLIALRWSQAAAGDKAQEPVEAAE